ncbi:MAG: nicotinate-nucleotide--dimethylbenzimidazole phosphoribosyltransferase [Lentisphaerae bacterium RIFOXYB12_FULL_60_10]|nr:MAG: nicotinate-nucleotide--dimethylbenzimidazole phosphoribosyltransferase [Lentisphaerae bacterium RIFOXYB12_FULL_60_10]
MEHLEALLNTIKPVDHALETAVQAHLDDLTKPRGSLGLLESMALQYCLAVNQVHPAFGRKHLFCFAGDHGVAAEGVSAFPQAVTPQMVRNMLAGGAAINVLCRHTNTRLTVVDMGVADPLEGAEGLSRHSIRPGTGNIARGPAMTEPECRRAIQAGAELAREAVHAGCTLLGTGEMGIANTTPSAALFAQFMSLEPALVAGHGTGITEPGLQHKVEVIRTAIRVNAGRCATPLGTLAALGGFEIAGLCGLMLGGAAYRTPVAVDGFISSAAALAACRICPHVRDYLFFSHRSQEKGHAVFFKEFKAAPILDLGLRLGEGTGAVLAMNLMEAAMKLYGEMATFHSAGVAEKATGATP